MARRREPSVLDDIFELLKVTPAWVGPVLAGVIFLIFRFVIAAFLPAQQRGFDVGTILRPLLPMLSWLFTCAVILAWVSAELWKLMNRRLLDSQTGLASIRDMSWRDFERLVSEAYRRNGYMAEVVGTDSCDGGVDIRLSGHSETVLVQCKQWKAYKVGVTTIRELLGVVVSERASRGIVVTSGRFTQDALAFGRLNPQIELVDGPKLAQLIRGVQSAAPPRDSPPPIAPTVPSCPLCSSPMVLRMAKKGQNAGSQFWGCTKFPTAGCRGTKQVSRG